ncbi:MAG: hypothetical protein ACI4I5_05640 [Acutalibacteraceae bacterium]
MPPTAGIEWQTSPSSDLASLVHLPPREGDRAKKTDPSAFPQEAPQTRLG